MGMIYIYIYRIICFFLGGITILTIHGAGMQPSLIGANSNGGFHGDEQRFHNGLMVKSGMIWVILW